MSAQNPDNTQQAEFYAAPSRLERARYYASVWSLFSFGLIFVPLLMLIFFGYFDAVLQPIASVRVGAPIAFICVLIIAFYMFSLCDDLNARNQVRAFKKKPGPSMAVLALVFFVLAIVCIFLLSFALSVKGSLVGPPDWPQESLNGQLEYGGAPHMILKLSMTGALMFAFIFLALSAGAMAVYEYGKTLETKIGPPIYADTNELREKVLSRLGDQFSQGGGTPKFTTLGLRRLEDGGLALTILHEDNCTLENDTRQIIVKERTWVVEASLWGNITKIEEKSLRIIQGPRLPAPPDPET